LPDGIREAFFLASKDMIAGRRLTASLQQIASA